MASLIEVLDQCMPCVSEFPDDNWKKAELYATNVAHVLQVVQDLVLEEVLSNFSPILAG